MYKYRPNIGDIGLMKIEGRETTFIVTDKRGTIYHIFHFGWMREINIHESWIHLNGREIDSIDRPAPAESA
jgi:hypothetical protein